MKSLHHAGKKPSAKSGFMKTRDPEYSPQMVGFPYNGDPNKVPRISETPKLLRQCRSMLAGLPILDRKTRTSSTSWAGGSSRTMP